MSMTPQEYIEQRLDNQIAWYDGKSTASHRWYRSLRVAEVVLAASIPFIAGFIDANADAARVLTGAAGAMVAIISGVLAINKFHEKWIEYRTTCESLKHHKYRFLAGVGPYTGDGALELLVDNVESLISTENTNWAEYVHAESKEGRSG
jgi:hypothetical protein